MISYLQRRDTNKKSVKARNANTVQVYRLFFVSLKKQNILKKKNDDLKIF